MTDGQMWMWKVGLALVAMALSSIIVLVVGVKVGEYLEASRVVKGELRRLVAAQQYYEQQRNKKYKDALEAEMLEGDFSKWEGFYAELGQHRT